METVVRGVVVVWGLGTRSGASYDPGAAMVVPLSVREWNYVNNATMFGALYVVYGPIVGFLAYLVAGQFDAA